MAVDKVDQPVSEIRREVRTEVRGTIFSQPPGDVYARVLLCGQLDVGIGLVVTQEDIESRLPLFDEIVLERQCFFLVVNQNVIDVMRLGEQSAGLGIRQVVVGKVTPHAEPQALGLAYVDDSPGSVLIEVHTWSQRKLRGFISKVLLRQYN
jgi:hypothetical protein